ncbi:dTDP-4-dehydrorhamnose 3,5-epimerase [candidate division KSB1 bacterium]
MIKVLKTKLDNVLLIKPDVFEDHRGEYIEIYNKELYKKHNIDISFVEDDISVSTKNVLRGIHGDADTWKLISCLYGKFYLVVVNCDKNSKRFGKWQSFVLSEKNRMQVLVPPKFGNGHLVLSEKTIFHYKQSTYYDPKKQFTYMWNDPQFNIWWPVKNPVLSQRDEEGRFI